MSSNWSREQYEQYLRSKNKVKKANDIVQEFKDPVQKQEDRKAVCSDKPRVQEKDESMGIGYRIDIIFLVSDKRRRDPTGMFETIADVLVRAVRRFNQGNPDGLMADSKSK